jgi:hypothetical protein
MGQPVPREIWQGQARASLLSLNRENQLREALGGWSFGSFLKSPFGHDRNPFADMWRFAPGSEHATRTFRERAPELGSNPEIMAEFRKLVDSWKLPAESRAKVDDALKAAFPESFSAATKMAAADMERMSGAVSQSLDVWQRFNGPLQQLSEGMGRVNTQAAPLSDTLRNTQGAASRMPPALDRATGAAQSFADRVNALDVKAPAPLALPPLFQPQSGPAPARGIGVSPASLTRRPAADLMRGVATRASVNRREFNFNAPLVSIKGDAPAAHDPEVLVALIHRRLLQEEEIAEARA